MEPSAGDLLIGGRYRLEERIGEGAGTVVYRAQHVELDMVFAIKVLVGQGYQERSLERFHREAAAYARIRHDGVIRIFDVGQTDAGQPYLVMEYVPGGSLEARLQKGRLTVQEVRTLGLRLTAALGALHSVGMIHGDVKPANIFLPAGSLANAKLGDFGLVDDVAEATGHTRAGVVLGTPYYMSPEQAMGQGRSAASDVWGLGVLLYRCVYERFPFDGDSLIQVLRAVVEETPRFEPLPDGLEQVLARALAKEESARFQSMADFAAALAKSPAEQAIRTEAMVTSTHGAPLAPLPAASSRPPPAPSPSALRLPSPSSPPSSPPSPSASPWQADAPFNASFDAAVEETRMRSSRSSRSPRALLWLAPLSLLLAVGAIFILRKSAVGAGVVAAAAAGALSTLVVRWVLSRLETRAARRRRKIQRRAVRLRQRADVTRVLSQSVALAVDKLLADSAGEPAVDLRKVSLALAIDDFQRARDRDQQRDALDRAIAIADKLSEQLERRDRPWYARHKEALTIATALISAAAALLSGIAARSK